MCETAPTAPARASRQPLPVRGLLRAARRGDGRARERLAISQLGLVRSVASRYVGMGMPLEDLVQEGTLGLLDAIDRYDPARSADFAAFARFRVRRAIRDALTDQARPVRLPEQLVARRRVLRRAADALATAQDGRAPTPDDLASVTGLSVDRVREALAAPVETVSLDAPLSPGGSTLASLLADPAAVDPELEALRREAADAVDLEVALLPARQREIVARRFGLGVQPQGIDEIAAALHVSPRRARTIGSAALDELRRALEPAETVPV
jgi:RNA polymerase sigma factor (sigma-70 family)